MLILEIIDREGSGRDYRTGGEYTDTPDGSIEQQCPQCKGTGTENIKRALQRNNNDRMQGSDLNPSKACTACKGKGYSQKIEGYTMTYTPTDYENVGQFKAAHPEVFAYIKQRSQGKDKSIMADAALKELKANGTLSKERFRKIEGAVNNKPIEKDAARKKWDAAPDDRRQRATSYNRSTKGQYGNHK